MHFSVQRDHVHLVVEARDARALSSGMRSVAIRVARYVNDLLSRRGSLWADRWHGRALTSPREVRNVLLYVLANFRKHARSAVVAGIDGYSSGAWFDGWREWRPNSGRPPSIAGPRRPSWLRELMAAPGDENEGGKGSEPAKEPSSGVWTVVEGAPAEMVSCPVLPARTWLAGRGWRRHGLLGVTELPA